MQKRTGLNESEYHCILDISGTDFIKKNTVKAESFTRYEKKSARSFEFYWPFTELQSIFTFK